MGCCYSRLEKEEMVSRCKARRRYMKQFVKARHTFSAAHTLYLRCLRSTGSALLQFANAETNLHHHHYLQQPQPQHQKQQKQKHHHLPPLHPQPPPTQPLPPPPPPPPLSSSSDNSTSVTYSALPPPPPPPPSSWDFWDPFAPSSSRSVTEEEEWESTTIVSEPVTTVAASVAPPPSTSIVSGCSKDTTTSELAMVVSRNAKDLVEIIKEVDEYFLKAADSGAHVSFLLEASSSAIFNQRSTGKVYNCGKNLSPLPWTWGSNSKSSSFRSISDVGGGGGIGVAAAFSHSSTVERLYAWERKLFEEVKNAESIKLEHDKRVEQLRKQELKGADYIKIDKSKKEIEKMESMMTVATQAIETTSAEIIRVREIELYPQLIELVKGLMSMWRSMYECHQVQTHIVEQLKFLNTFPSTVPTSEIHRQSTLQLELEVQQWHLAFCDLVKSQRDYMLSITGWLRLSLFQFHNEQLTKTRQNSAIYSLCEEWQQALDRIPDKVASEGIKSFLTVIHAIVVQQADEHKQKKRSEAAFKELEKKVLELRSMECKYPNGMSESYGSRRNRNPVAEKQAKVDILRTKAEEEKSKHEKLVSVSRAMTLNNLQMGFPHLFQALTGFSSVCMRGFETVCSEAKGMDQCHDLKRLLP